jgi:hypothetical protein
MPSVKQKKAILSRRTLTNGALALGGMIVGAVVGIVVQVGVESTGLLGPSVESLLAEQDANFDQISAHIDELRGISSDPQVTESLAELDKLLARQVELQNASTKELEYLGGQVASLRDESLNERGFAGGADVWLGVGESISVGDTSHVFGVVRMWANAADVNFNGTKSRLSAGDSARVDGHNCAVFLKQGRRDEDARAGFDVVCE